MNNINGDNKLPQEPNKINAQNPDETSSDSNVGASSPKTDLRPIGEEIGQRSSEDLNLEFIRKVREFGKTICQEFKPDSEEFLGKEFVDLIQNELNNESLKKYTNAINVTKEPEHYYNELFYYFVGLFHDNPSPAHLNSYKEGLKRCKEQEIEAQKFTWAFGKFLRNNPDENLINSYLKAIEVYDRESQIRSKDLLGLTLAFQNFDPETITTEKLDIYNRKIDECNISGFNLVDFTNAFAGLLQHESSIESIEEKIEIYFKSLEPLKKDKHGRSIDDEFCSAFLSSLSSQNNNGTLKSRLDIFSRAIEALLDKYNTRALVTRAFCLLVKNNYNDDELKYGLKIHAKGLNIFNSEYSQDSFTAEFAKFVNKKPNRKILKLYNRMLNACKKSKDYRDDFTENFTKFVIRANPSDEQLKILKESIKRCKDNDFSIEYLTLAFGALLGLNHNDSQLGPRLEIYLQTINKRKAQGQKPHETTEEFISLLRYDNPSDEELKSKLGLN